MGGKSGSKVTVGYKYYLGMHMALCHGVIDYIREIAIDKRNAWTGYSSGPSIEIDKEELFGGEGREGGVSGVVDVLTGEPDQAVNSYLETQLGADIPAFRGVTSVVLRQMYMGNNPYMKPWSFLVRRISKTSQGLEQWYPNKAPIGWIGEAAVYVALDRSGSMAQVAANGSTYWENLQASFEAAFTPLLGIPSGAKLDVKVALFAGKNTPGLYSTFYNATGADIQTLIDFVNGSAVDTIGGTDFSKAFNLAEEFFAQNDRARKVSVFITDGVPSVGDLSEQSKIDNAQSAADLLFATPNVEAYGINIDLIDTTYTEYVDNTPEDGVPIVADGDPDELQEVMSKLISSYFAMNPAHIIRECLTDSAWGMGYTASDIDDVSFTAAADILFDEAMGISILWSQELPIEEFIAEILRHIDGALYVDRSTGKFVLKLIREPSPSGLLVLDESNVISVTGAKRPAVSDLVASVTVNFWDFKTGETASVTKHNQALYGIQAGGGGATTVQYPGFPNYNIASRAAVRDLTALSTPLLSCTVTATREAEQLNVGDAFVLSWPDLGINSVTMRVQQMQLGDAENTAITIDAVEDVFDLLAATTAAISTEPEDGLWEDPISGTPLAASPRLVTEAPYWAMVQGIGETAVNNALADENDAGYLLVAAGRQANEINARMVIDAGAGYEDRGSVDFCPSATLSVAAWYDDASLHLTGEKDIGLVEVGSVAQVGQELIRVDSVGQDSNGYYITAGRGVLDSAPDKHAEGTSVIFWGFSWDSDLVGYVASDQLDVKLRTVIGSNTLALSTTPVDTVTMDSRAYRPYPPGDLRVDTLSYPGEGSVQYFFDTGTTIEWVPRDRTQQTDAYLYDYSYAGIGPEAGTTYIVRLEALTVSELSIGEFAEYDVGASTSFVYDGVIDSNADGVPAGTAFVKVKVYSKRGGYESRVPTSIVLTYAGDSTGDDGMVIIDAVENTGTPGKFQFSAIPGGYNRLILKGRIRGDLSATTDGLRLYLNGDTTDANYYMATLRHQDGTVDVTSAANAFAGNIPADTALSSAYATFEAIIEDYASTTDRKTVTVNYEARYAAAATRGGSVFISSSITGAITSLVVQCDNDPTDELYGKITLYGEY